MRSSIPGQRVRQDGYVPQVHPRMGRGCASPILGIKSPRPRYQLLNGGTRSGIQVSQGGVPLHGFGMAPCPAGIFDGDVQVAANNSRWACNSCSMRPHIRSHSWKTCSSASR